MSYHNPSQTGQESGFTLVELIVVITIVAVVFGAFTSFFITNTSLYTDYQYNASNFSELASQSQRVSGVLRGLTDIISETSNDLSVYAYFAPTDTYVSIVHYYLSANGKALMADVTPMTSNPPIGTPITAKKLTYTIITNYTPSPGVNLFSYYDASGTMLTLPIYDEHSIMEIQVSLAEPIAKYSKGQTLNVKVFLRNRKTNL